MALKVLLAILAFVFRFFVGFYVYFKVLYLLNGRSTDVEPAGCFIYSAVFMILFLGVFISFLVYLFY